MEKTRQPSPVVLVGTYRKDQLEKWVLPKGLYNYPVKDSDTAILEDAPLVSELWLYAGKQGKRRFSAQLDREVTAAELAALGYPRGKGKPHAERYLLFKISPLAEDEISRRDAEEAETQSSSATKNTKGAKHAEMVEADHRAARSGKDQTDLFAANAAHMDAKAVRPEQIRLSNTQSSETADRPRVLLRLSDFTRSAKVRAELAKRFDGQPSANPTPDEKKTYFDWLPEDLLEDWLGNLFVCEAAEQLCFWDIPTMESFKPEVPFPLPDNPNFTFIDLFAGVGGIRMGFQNAGGKCVFSSEWNAEAAKTYCQNFGEYPSGDITKIPVSDIPDFDVLLAGFPCQPFSISGKMKGFTDTRGTLFFEVCRIIEAKQPKVVFLENVKHLVHHDNGRTLRTILEKLEAFGYQVVWKVLNGSDFGVPQNRERIIIVASRSKTFDFSKVSTLTRPVLSSFLDTGGNFEILDPSAYTLIENPKRQEDSGLIFAGYRNKSIRKVGVRPNTLHLSRVHKQPNRIYSVNGIHPTLPSQESSGRYFILTNEGIVRKLTINECWRIMGFPETFLRPSAVGEQYKQLGNSVCVPMIESVAKEVVRQLLQKE